MCKYSDHIIDLPSVLLCGPQQDRFISSSFRTGHLSDTPLLSFLNAHVEHFRMDQKLVMTWGIATMQCMKQMFQVLKVDVLGMGQSQSQ